MLTDELSTSKNIRKTANRHAVQSAIRSTLEKLKLYKRVPTNGLIIFCGEVENECGKVSKLTEAHEPFRPITRSLYHCDSRFHTDLLHELLQSEDRFGFIVMDGNGCLVGAVSGSNREVLHKFSVELPRKHGRGGQSALRFARLRLEKRHNYVRKCAELAKALFIEGDQVNCTGIVLAGSADFKSELYAADLFDPRLQQRIVSIVDVAYGGMNGFNQAIDLAAGALKNVQLVREQHLLQKYFEEIALDSGKYCFGIRDTMLAIQAGQVDTVLCWNELEIMRVVVQQVHGCPAESNATIEHLNTDELALLVQSNSVQVLEQQSVIDWFCDNCKSVGARVEFVTDRSSEGSQFCRGFGGIGALLRYQADFAEACDEQEVDTEFDMDSAEYFV